MGTAAPNCVKALIASRCGSGPYNRSSKSNGEGGIQTPGTGVTQYDGLANRLDRNVNPDANATYESDEENLAFCLALLRRKSPDLALLVERWDTLPDVVKTGIVAMVQAAQGRGD